MKKEEEETVKKALQALYRARALHRSRREYGIQGIKLHVKDVDGDWLENWSAD